MTVKLRHVAGGGALAAALAFGGMSVASAQTDTTDTTDSTDTTVTDDSTGDARKENCPERGVATDDSASGSTTDSAS
jgi:hypothetical protein